MSPMVLGSVVGNNVLAKWQPYVSVHIINSADQSLTIIGLDGTYPNVGGDGSVTGPAVLSASILYGFDMTCATATVELSEDPRNVVPNLAEYSLVQIFCGSDPNNVQTYTALRFTGFFLRIEAQVWPHSWKLVCRGNLYRAELYRQAAYVDQLNTASLSFLEQNTQGIVLGQPLMPTADNPNAFPQYLIGSQNTDMTDQNIVFSILSQVDVNVAVWALAVLPSLAVQFGNIQGTSRLFDLPPIINDLSWPPMVSALEMIQKLDYVCLGYRTFEDLGGTIRRLQVFGYPLGPSDTQFTEGVDVWDQTHGIRTVENLINACYVEGLSVSIQGGSSSGGVPAVFAFVQQQNPFQPPTQPIVAKFGSSLIGTSDIIDAGVAGPQPQLNANRVAEWKLSELNRELVNMQLVTFRDDLLMIGHTISVLTPHAAVTEPVWIQRVQIDIKNQPASFQQTVFGIGGGNPDYGQVLTGTASTSAGSPTLTGSGTSFTTQVVVGDVIQVSSGVNTEFGVVASITNDTDLTISIAWTDAANSSTQVPYWPNSLSGEMLFTTPGYTLPPPY